MEREYAQIKVTKDVADRLDSFADELKHVGIGVNKTILASSILDSSLDIYERFAQSDIPQRISRSYQIFTKRKIKSTK